MVRLSGLMWARLGGLAGCFVAQRDVLVIGTKCVDILFHVEDKHPVITDNALAQIGPLSLVGVVLCLADGALRGVTLIHLI